MKIIVTFICMIHFSLSAIAAEKCAGRVKLAVLDWVREIFESDLEATRQLGRMKSAEFLAGKEFERRAADKKAKK